MIRLLLIGILMGIADVIPGISGGTIAFLTGIYEDLLLSIQSLQLQAPSRIAWRFLLPLGAGIGLSVLTFAHVISYLLGDPVCKCYLYALFFGLILASALVCGKKAAINTFPRWTLFAVGAASAFILSGYTFEIQGPFNMYYMVLGGMLAAGAMLLPGISGSYVLYLMGIYPIAMAALTQFSEGWKIVMPLALGIALGFIVFSRLIHLLLKHFRELTLSLLTGFMVGGLRSVWPFAGTNLFLILLIMSVGIGGVFLLEVTTKRKGKKVSSFKGIRYNKKKI